MFELVEVERQRRGRNAQPLANMSCRKSFSSGLHEQPKNIEPRLVAERDKRGDGFVLFHISDMVEISTRVKTRELKRRDREGRRNGRPFCV